MPQISSETVRAFQGLDEGSQLSALAKMSPAAKQALLTTLKGTQDTLARQAAKYPSSQEQGRGGAGFEDEYPRVNRLMTTLEDDTSGLLKAPFTASFWKGMVSDDSALQGMAKAQKVAEASGLQFDPETQVKQESRKYPILRDWADRKIPETAGHVLAIPAAAAIGRAAFNAPEMMTEGARAGLNTITTPEKLMTRAANNRAPVKPGLGSLTDDVASTGTGYIAGGRVGAALAETGNLIRQSKPFRAGTARLQESLARFMAGKPDPVTMPISDDLPIAEGDYPKETLARDMGLDEAARRNAPITPQNRPPSAPPAYETPPWEDQGPFKPEYPSMSTREQAALAQEIEDFNFENSPLWEPPRRSFPSALEGPGPEYADMQEGKPINPIIAAMEEARRTPNPQSAGPSAAPAPPWEPRAAVGIARPQPPAVPISEPPAAQKAGDALRRIEENLAPSGRKAQKFTQLVDAQGEPTRFGQSLIDELPELPAAPDMAAFDRTLVDGLRKREAGIDAADATVPPQTPVNAEPIADRIAELIDEYAGDELSTNQLKKEWERWAGQGHVPWEEFTKVKRNVGKNLKSPALRRYYKILMDAGGEISPAVAKANKSYSTVRRAIENAGIDAQTGRRIGQVGKRPKLKDEIK